MSPQPFAHLLPSEALIWARFLQLHGPEWDFFDYDVHVGEGHPIDPNWPDYIKVMVAKLSPKRVDVVGFKGKTPTIFEVSPRATRAVIGALFMYEYLYRLARPDTGYINLAAVVPRIDPDMARYLKSEGVTVYLVEGIVPV